MNAVPECGKSAGGLTGIKVRPGRLRQAGRSIRKLETHMTRLALVIFSIASVTLMGIAVVVALVIGQDTLVPIVVAAALGLVASVPVSWMVARQIA